MLYVFVCGNILHQCVKCDSIVSIHTEHSLSFYPNRPLKISSSFILPAKKRKTYTSDILHGFGGERLDSAGHGAWHQCAHQSFNHHVSWPALRRLFMLPVFSGRQAGWDMILIQRPAPNHRKRDIDKMVRGQITLA